MRWIIPTAARMVTRKSRIHGVSENADPKNSRASASTAPVSAAALARGRNLPVLIWGLSVHFSRVKATTTVTNPRPAGAGRAG